MTTPHPAAPSHSSPAKQPSNATPETHRNEHRGNTVLGNVPAYTTQPGSIRLFPMPDCGTTPILQALKSARSSVDLSVYECTDAAVEAALKAAAQRGVTVRVMLEPKVYKQTGVYEAAKKALSAPGITLQPTPPQFDSHDNVDHAKFMLIDKQRLLFGTGNLTGSGLGGDGKYTNRDFWVEDTHAPTVAEAQHLFDLDWTRGSSETTQAFSHLVVSPNNARATLKAFIQGARHRLYVYNQEYKDDSINKLILEARQRGVDVQVLGAQDNGNEPALEKFREAGIPARELTKYYLHAKAIVADDRVFIGSQNFSTEALDDNRELGKLIDDPGLVQQLVQTFESDFASTT